MLICIRYIKPEVSFVRRSIGDKCMGAVEGVRLTSRDTLRDTIIYVIEEVLTHTRVR